MINIQEIFDNPDIAKVASLWIGDNSDGADLAGAAEYAAGACVPMVSVVPCDVKTVWPWLEKLDIKILSRFYAGGVGQEAISDMVARINSVFKQGATGAQIIVKLSDLDKFSDSIWSVRNDLFFNKDLSIGLDVFGVWPNDWAGVFKNLQKVSATSLLLILTHDDMEKSDFVGRIYGALDAWNPAFNIELHIMLNESYTRAEQVYRLVAALRPELLDRLRFFVNY